MDMEKKNPYVTTIGFNRKDPNHRKVAELLNEMGRGKAQYIVNAVTAYQNNGDQHTIAKEINYKNIRRLVKEILAENENTAISAENERRSDLKKKEKNKEKGINEEDMKSILESLSLFK